MIDSEVIENNCKYKFKNKKLLERALTLSSYDGVNNNESLECLGDALLTFIVAEEYYLKGENEGGITLKKQQLLSDEALRPVSVKLGLDKALLKDKGDTGNKKAIPSAYEAVCGAIYLDGGLDAARKFALNTLTPAPLAENFVGELKELLEKRGEKFPEPQKTDLGNEKEHLWEVSFLIDGKLFNGQDKNSDCAKKLAAQKALEYLRQKNSKG